MNRKPNQVKKISLEDRAIDAFLQRARFDLDENGKVRPLFRTLKPTVSKEEPSSNKRSAEQSPVKLQRLDLALLKEEYLINDTNRNKRRRTDTNWVRKELFKAPRTKSGASFRGKENKTNLKLNKTQRSPVEKGISPLTAVTPASSTKSTRKLLPTIYEQPQQQEETKSTPRSLKKSTGSSESSFLGLEEYCGVEVKMVQSPLTDMCKLLQKTDLKEMENNLNPIDQIKALLDEEQREAAEYQLKCEMRKEKIRRLLDQLNNKCFKSDNGPIRRSARLSGKSISPAISKGVDLRKMALSNTLQKSLLNTPTVDKAVQMYNNLRQDCSLLSTPQINRTAFDLSPSVMKSLSKRLQTQCLLLQATPLHR